MREGREGFAVGPRLARRTVGGVLPPADTPGDSHSGEPGSQSSAAQSPRWQEERRKGDPAPHEIARAVEPGCRRARNQRGWLKDVLEVTAAAGWRKDRLENWESIVRVLA